MVTSVTKLAPLVQFGELVGIGVSSVGDAVVASDSFVGGGVLVGADVAVGAEVSVGGRGAGVSVGGWVPHDETSKTTTRHIAKSVFFMTSSFQMMTGNDDFIIAKTMKIR